MKVDKVIPCVCLDHQLTFADSGYECMPQLMVEPSGKYFSAFCPKCGRGGATQHKSAYLALKSWNEMQEWLWKSEKSENLDWMYKTYDIDW